MTRIKYKSKATWRESEVVTVERSRARIILVALEPAAILLRLKGTRGVLRLPYSVALFRAAGLEASRKGLEKARKRKTVKRGH